MSRKPYMIDPSVQTGPQYGSAGAMYPAGFSTGPAPNSQAVPAYPSQPANTRYPSADIYNPADSINTQPGGVPPGTPPANAAPAWNDPPVLKNSSRPQVHNHFIHIVMVSLLYFGEGGCLCVRMCRGRLRFSEL
jgi:hypothetical protein